MSRVLTLVLALSTLPLAVSACGSAEPHARPPSEAAGTPAARPAGSPEDYDLCVRLMDRSRDCTDAFIPALVDARAAADVPAGIAAQVKADRDGVIAQAKQEWTRDSEEPRIEAHCHDPMPAEAGEREEARRCLAESDCGAFVSCEMPLFSRHFPK